MNTPLLLFLLAGAVLSLTILFGWGIARLLLVFSLFKDEKERKEAVLALLTRRR